MLMTLEQDATEGQGMTHLKQMKQMVGNLTSLSQYILNKNKDQTDSIS